MKLKVLKVGVSKAEFIKQMEEDKRDDAGELIQIYLFSTLVDEKSCIGDVATNDEEPNSIGIVLRGTPGQKQTEAGIRLALASMMEHLLDTKKFTGYFVVSRSSFISDIEYEVFACSFKELLLTSYRSFEHIVTLIVTDEREGK